MTDEKRIEAIARARYACLTNPLLPWERLSEDQRSDWLREAARFAAGIDAIRAHDAANSQPCWSCEGTGVEPRGTEHKDQPADLDLSKAGEDGLIQRIANFMDGGRRTGHTDEEIAEGILAILSAQSPREVSREEIADVVSIYRFEMPLRSTSADCQLASLKCADKIAALYAKPERRKGERRSATAEENMRYQNTNGSEFKRIGQRRAPSPAATLEAETEALRAQTVEHEATITRQAECVASFENRCWTLEAENKRLRDEVKRWETRTAAANVTIADLYAVGRKAERELAALKSHPSAITAEGLAEALGAETGLNPGVEFSQRIIDRLSAARTEAKGASEPVPLTIEAGFQARVHKWMLACFGDEIAADSMERNHRFLEESLELVQACGCSAHEAHQLVDYVFGRAVGEKAQEVGGVLVTLAALCSANGLTMEEAGETELARIWMKVEQIRAKQAAKPKHSPLPMAPPAPPADPSAEADRVLGANLRRVLARDHTINVWLSTTGGWKAFGATSIRVERDTVDGVVAAIAALASGNGK